jgi:2-haloacid dehalogenase
MSAKAVAFDLGNVIFRFDYRKAMRALDGKISRSHDDVLYEHYFGGMGEAHEKGHLDAERYFERFCAFSGLNGLSLDAFKRIWADIFVVDNDTVALIRDLRNAGVPLFLISNICDIHWDFLFSRYPDVFALFDGLVLSYKVGSVKPERKIYAELAHMSSRRPKDIVYFDDRLDLIFASRLLGFDAHAFTEASAARAVLAEKGLRV